MSISSEDRKSHSAGFMLVEVLVALTIAVLFLAVFAQGLATAWSRARRPAETAWALAVAREVAARARNGDSLDEGDIGAFHYETTYTPLKIEPLKTSVLAEPHAFGSTLGQQQAPHPGVLRLITIQVTGPSGHEYHYESIKLELSQSQG